MNSLLLLLLTAATPLTGAEVQMLPSAPLAVFGGGARLVPVSFQNLTALPVELEIGMQLLQASSGTVAPFGPVAAWKSLALLAHQTAQEEVPVQIPAVRAQTRFLVRFAQRGEVLGLVEVWAYPSNLLAELNALLGGEPVILCSVPDSWKQLLGAAGVDFLEVAPKSPPARHYSLAVVGALEGADTALSWAKSAVGVIWLKPPSIPAAASEPSYYALSVSNTTLVVAQAHTVTNLDADPWAQLRLLRMARLATGSEHLSLPKTNP